jgi:hypothetical protein
MASREHKIGKKAADRITRHITFIIPETLKIIRKLASATHQCVIMAVYKNGLLAIYIIKKHKEKITHKKSGQYRWCMINGTPNNPASLQSSGCQSK